MWNTIREALKGKKTNLISVWAFCGALFMWMNEIGEVEQAAILATVAALGASLKAGIVRQAVVPFLLIGLGISFTFLGGCAALGEIGPGGTTPAEDLVGSAAEIASLFGPLAGTVVPIGLGAVLSAIITLGRVKDASQPST